VDEEAIARAGTQSQRIITITTTTIIIIIDAIYKYHLQSSQKTIMFKLWLYVREYNNYLGYH
jgi:hypothetical protein